ncbi:TATA-binding protein-associated factor [Pseudolycoriella hygida]|uniref:TATA-binding protein-associated factor n=1 Tax=Pseudolycoriella hygida TaxID=35572 RepID=A0A9Q0MNW2_9DIPT|nr:TATA-binding protein-associated factor [Pseudolycoriella hygida]
MTSRLDRLFILLESGSSAVTRRAAAKQIGEVQKLHPHELHNLLNRLHTYLHSSSWDTRVAAAQAVDAILSNVPSWNPSPCSFKIETKCITNFDASRLTFSNFDLSTVLERGARLMGSEGSEFDQDQFNEFDDRDHLLRQRALLNEKLGFSKAGVNVSDLVSLDDIKSSKVNYDPNIRLMPVQDILNADSSQKSTDCSSQALSCREMNRARRKARQNFIVTNSGALSRSNSTNCSNGSTSDMELERKKPKLETKSESVVYHSNEPVPDGTGSWGDATDWPLESFCSRLYLDLFNPRWETRHGAATALRELLKSHSAGAGKSNFMTKEEMDYNHMLWLEDAALRLLCVLSLDRFGDFISDQVVAPVRETCAQVLGTVLKEMSIDNVKYTVMILLKLIKQNEWEVRHGGLLGLKYMLVVREDLLQTFLPFTINDILMGLFDSVDDVGAVAASTLTPIASWLPKLLTAVQVSSIVKMLWDLLLDQDELTSACNSFMGLLSAILSLNNPSNWIQMEPMSILIPRLWPFLSHSTSSVRRSTLQTLKTLTKNAAPIVDAEVVKAQSNGNSIKIEVESLQAVIEQSATSLSLNFGVKDWPADLLQDALRHVYQRVLVEHITDIQLLVEDVWYNLVTNAELSALLHASCPYVASWMCLAMQPARLSFDPSLMIYAKSPVNRERKNKWPELDLGSSSKTHLQKMYIGGIETTPVDVRERNIPRARSKASKMLGLLSRYLVLPAPGVVYAENIESPINCYTKILLGYLSSRSALQRLISGMVIAYWAESDPTIVPGPPQLQQRLNAAVTEYVCYDENTITLTRLLQESRDFISTLKQLKVKLSEFDNCKYLSLDQIQALSTTLTENLKEKFGLKARSVEILEEKRRGLQNSLAQTNFEQNALNVSTQAILAGANVFLGCLPEKLNPIVKPLMESIKREECEIFQQLSAHYLVKLLDLVAQRIPSPNNKIITNLCTLLKSDIDFTPKITIAPLFSLCNSSNTTSSNPYHGILTLANQQKSCETQNGNTVARGPGRPPVADVSVDECVESEDPTKRQNRTQRIGATLAIKAICLHFGARLLEKVPVFSSLLDALKLLVNDDLVNPLNLNSINIDKCNELITYLQLIEVVAPHIHNIHHEKLFSLLPQLTILLRHPMKAIRHMTSRCLATMALIDSSAIMDVIIQKGVKMLQTIEDVIQRQGAAEAISQIVNKLQFQIVPYVILLVVPLLGRMSDPDQSVRLISTHCFATLIQLMPLDGNVNDRSLLSTNLQERKSKDKEFLEYLFTPKKIPDFKVPPFVNAELRSYQQAGVNWLWFLNKYKLHGILCDDMGLGKTLQTICILAGDHYERQIEKSKNLPSLVICPPTLTGHWVYEVNKFLPQQFLKPLHYIGFPVDRERLRHKVDSYNLVVASYDIVRKDVEFFTSIHWNYVVLDEGHIIKNGKTKSSQAIKQLIANHRLILSGTPIQNSVLELWSLFDFLMPGFLGTEKQFISKFSRPILASRDAKSSAKEQEAGALAMESLHRQVLPFLLRRIKEDVLTDLPPKITQDLLCELSPLQERLYEDFSKSNLNSDIKDCLEKFDGAEIQKKTHVFQALRYLQNVCNHPKLVLTAHHPELQKIQQDLAKRNTTLDDIEHSAKLPALKQLLLDCGIGIEDSMTVNQHRALIFCQLKAMLDIVENDLLKKHLPAISYLRLDGSVPPSARHHIVTKFNSDPSIDVLLLTTQVGGLGLNLTGADTVIFVEHDWNPMKDLQAMDRAHRIGQKKVVNVYRLITRKSLEEKIMGLQKFKLITANTVVSDENASMETMGTDQLFDLFSLNDNNGKTTNSSESISGNVTMKQALEGLPELWDDKQYDEEYDLTQFLQGLK